MAATYFITGAQGCIGSWIVKALTERGDAAVVFDRSHDATRLEAIMEPGDLKRVSFIAGDITDISALRTALEVQLRAVSFISPDCKCPRAKLTPSQARSLTS